MVLIKNNNLSYWELKHYFGPYDLIVIGSGIVGLNAAISFKEKHVSAKVLVLEKGVFPEGASTKNAGFACFGSPGELLDDLRVSSEQAVIETISMRWNGLKMLRTRLNDSVIDYQGYGGYEIFRDATEYDLCQEKMSYLNDLVKHAIGQRNCFSHTSLMAELFPDAAGVIHNHYEGQIDTGRMMKGLTALAYNLGIEIVYNIEVSEFSDLGSLVHINSQQGTFYAQKLIIATNGFASQLLAIEDVKPARAQVLITKPIKDLKLKGSFHVDKGYYYFRNVDDRILLGGGRNLDFKTEETTSTALNNTIQSHLQAMLDTFVARGLKPVVDHRWTGIMGVGREKKPIIARVFPNCVAAVRMGGMGVAIGSLVGDLAAREIAG